MTQHTSYRSFLLLSCLTLFNKYNRSICSLAENLALYHVAVCLIKLAENLALILLLNVFAGDVASSSRVSCSRVGTQPETWLLS